METIALMIGSTDLSRMIVQTSWMIPWLQVFHIATLALVFGAVFMISARTLGFSAGGQSVAQSVKRYAPWVWIGTIVLAITGALLVIGEPVRSLVNAFFWIKMALLAAVLALTAAFQISLRNRPEFWENLDWRGPARFIALASLIAWIGIIFMGRFIAYVDTFIY